MRRRLLTGVLTGVLVLGVAAGCGIPDRSEVQIEQRGPAAETNWSLGRGTEPPTREASGSDAEAFVRNFLAAAAGEPDRAYERVKRFIATADRNGLPDKQGSEVALSVVRLTDDPVIEPDVDSMKVTISVQQVGLLRANGILVPPVATESTYEFRLISAGPVGEDDAGYYVSDPPNVLLLSDDALRRYYQAEAIYFWNSDRTQLVPDQRYLSSAVPPQRRVSEVVRWLTAGPSDWLRIGVSGLPDRTEMINNATGSDGRWEVNLDMPGADERRLEQLGTQLAWSLRELHGTVEVKILNQSRKVIDLAEQRRLNPLDLIEVNARRYCVYEGAIHSLTVAGEAAGSVPVAPEVNHDIVSAGLRRVDADVLVAVVMAGEDGRQRLAVGRSGGVVETLTTGPSRYAEMSRPVWIRSDGARPTGLVVADGRLYRFDDQAATRQVQLSLPGRVTAVAPALDGHRLALIVDGTLHVAAINWEGGVPTVGPARRLVSSLTDATAVDWSAANRLLVAGSAGRPAIYDVTVDGALETPLREDTGSQVDHLAAYPATAERSPLAGSFMYEANGVAYRSNPFDRINRDQVQDVTPPPAGVRPGNPTAPVFLY
ncbi:LpqB family beta-propeller domain-containing protein [Micromonospora sediminimaris]|uniref:LpqB family beta-propeller domain-containing protein n=1 Tax=Micromonospora TaxID=1873 RepID=UPI00249AC770|nr:LpqB family beta-propeller domain-containing protein [Verrucosispora sp. WMMD1129]WFE44826.1 GerMN domain-containing protein [Verrucosispora sp. WMMD1129]